MDLAAIRLKQRGHRCGDCLGGHRCGDCLGGFAFDLAHQREYGLAFNHTHGGLPVVLADDGIRFPVADPAARLNDGWAVFNRVAMEDAPRRSCLP